MVIIAVPISGVEAQETFLWEADVWSTGVPVTSPVLEAGREYRIVAKGSFASCDPVFGDVNFAGDAQYYTLEFDGIMPAPYNWWLWTSHLLASPSILQINGMDVYWGPFSNGGATWFEGHEYTIPYTGKGAAITFTIVDWIDGEYAHNYCHIHVKIYESPPPPPPPEEGKSPGYWKHEFNAYADVIVGARPKGSPHETWADLVFWTAKIDSASRLTPTPWNLPPLALIDYNGDGTFTTLDAYNIFNAGRSDPAFKMWLPLANWYNWAAGYGYYT